MASEILLKALSKTAITSSSSIMVMSLPREVFNKSDLIRINSFSNEALDGNDSKNFYSLVVAKNMEEKKKFDAEKLALPSNKTTKVKIILKSKALIQRSPDYQVNNKKLLLTFIGTIDKESSYKVFAPLLSPIGGIDENSLIDFGELSIAISEALSDNDKNIDQEKLEHSLRFLDQIYREPGSLEEDISFNALSPSIQWWKHIDDCLDYIDKYQGDINSLDGVHFSMFGLPCPDDGLQYSDKNKAKDYVKAVNDYWIDEERIDQSIEKLILKNDGDVAIERIDFGKFEETKEEYAYANAALSLADQKDDSNEINDHWLDSWDKMKEQDFFKPHPKLEKKKLNIKKSNRLLTNSKISQIQYLPIDKNIDDLSSAEYCLNEICLEYDEDTEFEKVEIPQKGIEWETLDGSGSGVICGRLKISPPKKAFRNLIEIEVRCAKGIREISFTTKLLIANPCMPTISVLEKKKTKHFNDWKYREPNFLPENVPEEIDYESKNNSDKISIEIYDGAINSPIENINDISLGSFRWQQDDNDKNLYNCEDITLQTAHNLIIKPDDPCIDLHIQFTNSNLSFNPFLSIFLDQPVDELKADTPEKNDYYTDIRSKIEERYLDQIKEKDFFVSDDSLSLGQIILSSKNDHRINFENNHQDSLEIDRGLEWCKKDGAVSGREFSYLKTPYESLKKEAYSDVLREFIDSFYNLGLEESNNIFSLRILHDKQEFKQKLDRYLNSFTNLLKETKKHDAQDFFWASYPFSAFITESSSGIPSISGIMLSPLHPLRLAWIYASQKAIQSSKLDDTLPLSLLSVIDGFDFPFVAKSSTFADDEMFISTPISNGFEDIFITWSYLKGVKDNIPEHIGGHLFPASSTTGLGAYAVRTAINDYLNVYPHVQSLNININSNSKYKDRKIDKEIIKTLNGLNDGQKTRLVGGLNVFDSENRATNQSSQHEELLSQLNNNAKLNWQYIDQTADHHRIDLSFQQDNNTNISMSNEALEGGTIPKLPIRRFYTRHYAQKNQVSYLNPLSPLSSDSWNEFNNALHAIETTENGKSLSIKNSVVTEGDISKANWSILGDYLLDPVATNMRLANNRELKILWDWKPPNFYQTNQNELNLFAKRPYVTISQVDSNISKNFRDNIRKTIPNNDSEEDLTLKFKKLMQQLGLKGIGLSSLLNQDTNKASGALGFYYAYKLIDQWIKDNSSDERIISVLPLDTVDGYIKSFVGDNKSFKEASKRADLLIMEIKPNDGKQHINLLPIEIKSYGINRADRTYDKQPDDASEQLEDTLKKLHAFKNSINNNHVPLKDTSLASMIDASFILSSVENSEYVRKAIEDIANGNSTICVDNGLILYFMNKAVTDGNERPDEIFQYRKKVTVLYSDPHHYHEFFWNDQNSKLNNQFSLVTESCLKRIGIKCIQEVSHSLTGLNGSTNDESEATTQNPVGEVIDNDNSNQENQPIVDHGQTTEGDESSAPIENNEFTENVTSNRGIEIHIGDRLNREDALIWYPSLTEKTNQLNMGVIGDLGSGKTQLLKSIIYQASVQSEKNRDHNIKFLILDYKEDYTGRRDDFVNHIDAKVIEPRRIPLNIFSTKDENDDLFNKRIKGRTLYTFLNQIYRGIGPVQKTRLLDAVESAYERNELDPTIKDVYQEYKNQVRSGDSVTSILSDLVDLDIFSNNHDELLSFEEFFNQSIVINLASIGTDVKLKLLIVTLILQLYYEYMLNMKKPPFLVNDSNETMRQIDSFVLVDEANELMKHQFDFLEEILTKGREYGVGVILASQYFSHFKTRNIDYTENLATWNIMLEKQVAGRDLQSIGISGQHDIYSDKINDLDIHQLLHKSYAENDFVENKPFFKIIEEENDS